MSPRPFVRRDVWTLDPDDPIVTAYARAVALMQSRPASDPTSWAHQAAIHGTHAASPPALSNECRHGNWYFLSWHRMYLFRFEQIVRAAVAEVDGPPDWALPYWNYGLGGQSATLPLAFRDPELPNGDPNPLFVAERAPGVNAGGTIPPQVASAARALGRPVFTGAPEFGGGVTSAGGQFFGQTGRLEQTPHNDIHNVLGGGSGWMSDPDQAAQDPIFWLHHANIDRIWDEWDPTGARAPADPRWAGQSFPLFDASGAQVSLRCEAVCDVVADLGYSYDSRPPAPDGAPAAGAPGAEEAMPPQREPEIVGATERPVTLVGGPESVTVPVDARARDSFAESVERPPHVYLNIEDIEAERNPGTVYGVYVDLPADPSPEQLDAHHVGNVSFFGIERARAPRGDEPSHGLRVSLDITELAERLGARAGGAERLDVTFRPLSLIAPEGGEQESLAPAPGADPPVSIGRVSIAYG